MSQILQFPKNKSKRVRAQKKIESQRLFLGLSLFAFILVAVFANEQILKNQRPIYLISDNSPQSIEQVNRAIASAQPMNLFRDVEWEHRLAKRLGQEKDRLPASVAKELTLLDQLRYGILAGKYSIQSSGAQSTGFKINEVQYVDSAEISDRPVHIRDHENFLLEYRSLLPVEFKKTTLLESKAGVETWSLISEKGEVTGQLQMRFDEEEHFMGFKVNKIGRVAKE